MTKEFGLHFGSFADSVKEQLEKQGYTLPSEARFETYDKLMFGYNMLRIHGVLAGIARSVQDAIEIVEG